MDLSRSINSYPVNFKFFQVGISRRSKVVNGKEYKTLGQIMATNGHSGKKITMIKMDVEGEEMQGLNVWLDEGSLDNVGQIAFEYHFFHQGIYSTLPNTRVGA